MSSDGDSGRGGVHNYGGVWGNVNSGPGTQYNFRGETIYVNLEAARKVAQHQPNRAPRDAIGRVAELADLREALAKRPCVAITGVGGIGKSTLAAMLGADAAAYTHHCWRNLSDNATDFSSFVQAALATLGLAFDPREIPQPAEQAEYLVEILAANADKVRLLLVVDNFESVIAADGSLALGWGEMLDRASHNLGPSRLLLTSRQFPHLAQGQEPRRFALGGLAIADGVALLQQLGVAGELARLQEVVTRAGGHPLALRFLADLIANEGYTLAQLLALPIWDERIAERLLDKIYPHLPAAQQQTLQYFSLFERPTAPATIAAILEKLLPQRGRQGGGVQDEPTIRHYADALAERSLLDGSGGSYTAHPIVRSYAHHLLPDPAAHHRAAATYFLQQYAASHPDAHSHPARNLADVQPLLDAFDQLCAAGDFEDAATVLYGISLEYMSGGDWTALHGMLSRWSEFSREMVMDDLLVNAPAGALRDSSRANALGNLGIAYDALGEYDKAIEHHNQHLALAQQIGDRQGEANALGNLGNAYQLLGEYDKAIENMSRVLEIMRQIGDRQGEASALGNLGTAYQSLDEYDKAITYHTDSLEIKRQIGNRQGEANALGNLGNAYQLLGEYDKAIMYHIHSLEIKRQIGDLAGQSRAWNNMGVALESLKHYRDALTCYFKALSIKERLGDPHSIKRTRNNIADIRAAVGEGDWAAVEAQARQLADDANWVPAPSGSDED